MHACIGVRAHGRNGARHTASRVRSAHVKERKIIPASALLEQLGVTMQQTSELFSRLTEADLFTLLDIQGYKVSGLAAIYHVVEHYGMHYGQILYVTKMLRGQDLGLYRELDKTGRAS